MKHTSFFHATDYLPLQNSLLEARHVIAKRPNPCFQPDDLCHYGTFITAFERSQSITLIVLLLVNSTATLSFHKGNASVLSLFSLLSEITYTALSC